MTKHHFSYLALGDSYTIGENVPLHESFPYQTIQLLRHANLNFNAPEIIAKTGWTTFELAEHILHARLSENYDFLTILIGVNNQYRGLSEDEYSTDFDFLLRKALHLSANKTERVIVLSIPDWGTTPFAKEMNQKQISDEIDAFNFTNKRIAEQYKVHYINVTESTRQISNDKTFLAADGLHYSGKEYAKWAAEIALLIKRVTK